MPAYYRRVQKRPALMCVGKNVESATRRQHNYSLITWINLLFYLTIDKKDMWRSKNCSHIYKVCWCNSQKSWTEHQKSSSMGRTRASLCSVSSDSSSSKRDFRLGDCDTFSADYMEVMQFFPCFRGGFWGADISRGITVTHIHPIVYLPDIPTRKCTLSVID